MKERNPFGKNPHRLPEWFKVSVPTDSGETARVARVLRQGNLHTVCHSAQCPNRQECWHSGTATFMILGDHCTRNCRFCAVPSKVAPPPPDPGEPRALAEAVRELGLRYVVITSVTRDDLPDGGAAQFAAVIAALRSQCPSVMIELLIPDFRGDEKAIQVVLDARADVVGHNLETVARLTPIHRDAHASFERSLSVLKWFSMKGAETKTSLMLGLGETLDEIYETLDRAREAGVGHLALGQYLSPSVLHSPVERYWTPEEFKAMAATAREKGFRSVAAGPLVRSSYKAHESLKNALKSSTGNPPKD